MKCLRLRPQVFLFCIWVLDFDCAATMELSVQ